MTANNTINHMSYVIDMSASMSRHRLSLPKIIDNQTSYLARRSQELNQETRITVYTFAFGCECIFYDVDVLRLPGMQNFYKPSGMTALLDAAHLAIDDSRLIPEKYGNHAHLIYLWSDGQENWSQNKMPELLRRKIEGLEDNRTFAALAPDQTSVFELKQFGVPAGNIGVWNADTTQGLEEAAKTIRTATDNFMTQRSTSANFRGTKNLFTLTAPSVSEVKHNLSPVSKSIYYLLPVSDKIAIKEFVIRQLGFYKTGNGFYELNKPETIQPDKQVAILYQGQVYTGDNARKLIGLPDYSVKVDPSNAQYAQYRIFVQSKSVNRNLWPGTSLLLFRK